MTLAEQIVGIARAARVASLQVAHLKTELKNRLLTELATALKAQGAEIQAANARDVEAAQQAGLTSAMVDRLILNEQRINEMAKGLTEVAALPDPVGQVVKAWERPNGLQVKKVRIPLGVIGMIYESRPNVTVDAAGLCLKSGNAIVLRGGSEAIHSNKFLGELMRTVLAKHDLNPDIIQVIPVTDREAMQILVKQTKYLDLMIPRGGENLMKWMEEHSRVPVIKHDKGICHVYVDKDADLKMAVAITFNAKVSRPGVCNAAETLLVHEAVAADFLPAVGQKLMAAGVKLRGDPATCKLIPEAKAATQADWDQEYLDLILAVRVVSSGEMAIDHIDRHGSMHTETIITQNPQTAEHFLNEVNSSVVLWNASTRFNDGGQLGLGAEIGISTTKIHAFGPMGLEELTTTKFVVVGKGQIRE